jgi:hypothetical protein
MFTERSGVGLDVGKRAADLDQVDDRHKLEWGDRLASSAARPRRAGGLTDDAAQTFTRLRCARGSVSRRLENAEV